MKFLMIFNYLLCILHLYFAPSIFLQFKHEPDRNEGQYLFAKKYIEEERYIYIISCMYVLVFQRTPVCVLWIDSTLWNTSNISMHIILIKGKKRRKRKTKIFTFLNKYNITKPIEFARGKFTDIEMNLTKKSSLLYFAMILTDKI